MSSRGSMRGGRGRFARSDGRNVQQLREGDQWKNIKRVIGINVLGGGKDQLQHWKDTPNQFIRHYKIQEQLNDPKRFMDGFEIIQYSLMNVPSELENKEKQDWLTFFKRASHMTEADVQKQITTPAVLQAFERAKYATLPHKVRELYDCQDRTYNCYSEFTADVAQQAEKKGIEMGIEKGKAEGKTEGKAEGKAERDRELARKWIEKGKSNTEILDDLDILETELNALRIDLSSKK